MAKKITEPVEHIYKSRTDILIDNLIGGIAWGVGSGVGVVAVAGVVGYSISQNMSAITSSLQLFLHSLGL